MTESSQDENINLLTYAEIEEVKGFIGNYEVTIRKKARSVDMEKCTGCGECQQKCPKKIPSEFDMGLGTRKAIYTPFTQAVPNVPVIDRENCIFFTKEKCQICSKVCPTNAVNYEQEDELITEKFGAIVVASGFEQFDWTVYGEYGGGTIPNIITGLHMERMLESSGPTGGHVIRPSDGKEAKDVVFIQCAGSRDEAKGMPYCSRICCMYTAKHALLLKDHQPDSQAFVFYIDIRSGGKNYEEFVKKVQREHGAVYIRGRVSKIYEQGNKLIVCGSDTLTGKPVKIEADLVVLAAAMVPQTDATELAQKLNIPYDKYGFFTEVHPKLEPVSSVTKGIFLTGASQFPRDIPDTVAMSGAAAVGVCGIFSHDELTIEPRIALVDEERCTSCLNCLQVCPFNAIDTRELNGRQYAYVQETLCTGCGNCASTCRVKAIKIRGFTDDQIYAQIKSAFA
jgi:heterodisulfide reductase subunit A